MTDYYCDENIKRVQRCEHGPAGFSTGDGHKMGLWSVHTCRMVRSR
mgnify:FL=1